MEFQALLQTGEEIFADFRGFFFCYHKYERQNDRIQKEKIPRSLGAQYATGDQWRNNSRKNEGMGTKQKNKNKNKTPSCGWDW